MSVASSNYSNATCYCLIRREIIKYFDFLFVSISTFLNIIPAEGQQQLDGTDDNIEFEVKTRLHIQGIIIDGDSVRTAFLKDWPWLERNNIHLQSLSSARNDYRDERVIT